MTTARSLCLLPLALLAACDEAEAPSLPDAGDPAVIAALSNQILVDPDLARSNRAGAALNANGAPSTELPPLESGIDAAASAKAAADRVVGGAMQTAPEAGDDGKTMADAATPAQLAIQAGARARSCAPTLQYSAIWAARLPKGIEVYPHGHTVDAAGTDSNACLLRIATYRVAVAPRDVIDWYFTRARSVGFQTENGLSSGVSHIAGTRSGGAGFAVQARATTDNLTEVDVVSWGA